MARRLASDPPPTLSLAFPALRSMEGPVIRSRYTRSYAVCFPLPMNELALQVVAQTSQGTGRHHWISAIAFQGCASGLPSTLTASRTIKFRPSRTRTVPPGTQGFTFLRFRGCPNWILEWKGSIQTILSGATSVTVSIILILLGETDRQMTGI